MMIRFKNRQLILTFVLFVAIFLEYIIPGSIVVFLIYIIFTNLHIIRAKLNILTFLYFLLGSFSLIALIYLLLLIVYDLTPIFLNEIRVHYVDYRSIRVSINIIAIFLSHVIIAISESMRDIVILKNTPFKLKVVYAALILLILSTIITNLGGNIIDGGYGSESFKSSRWGGWPLIFIFSVSIIIYQVYISKNNVWLKYFLFLSVFYWLLKGNRSEILVLSIIFFLPSVLVGSQKSVKDYFSLKNILVITTVLIIFNFVGLIRSEGISKKPASSISTNIISGDRLNISTIGPSLFTLTSSIKIVSENGFEYGITYLAYPYNSLPSFLPIHIEKIPDIAHYTKEANTIGGSMILAEPYINFGLFGVNVFSLIFFSFFGMILRKTFKSRLYILLLISFIVYFQRYYFYGFVYIYKLLLLFFVLIFINEVLKLYKKPS